MNAASDSDGVRGDGTPRTPHHSARVQLEVAILVAGDPGPSAPPAAAGERELQPIMIVAGEDDVRRYVRECLRDHADLYLIDARTVAIAAALAPHMAPHLLIVDAPEASVLAELPAVRAVLIVDEMDRDHASGETPVSRLVRPFSAERLVALVRALLDVPNAEPGRGRGEDSSRCSRGPAPDTPPG